MSSKDRRVLAEILRKDAHRLSITVEGEILRMLDPKVIDAAINWYQWFVSSPVRVAEANEVEDALMAAVAELPPAPEIPR